MPTFKIYTEQSLGFSHSGGDVYAEGAGEVELTDEEVQQLVDLIKAHNGQTDVTVLKLEDEFPELYEKLDEAYRNTAIDARYREIYIEAFYDGDFEEPVDDLMDYCEKNLGFEFEYDEEDYRDEETGEVDEEMLADDKAEYFWMDWLRAYFDSLSDDEKASFVTTHYDCDDIVVDDYDYDVKIPDEIIRISKEGKA